MSRTRCKTILTIDDEELVRKILADLLHHSGYEVIEAKDGEQGIEIFRREKPDLILVDLHMPGIDGLQVISTVNKESPNTPIIVVSGGGSLKDAIDAVRRGAWDYITKPVTDMVVLEHAIENSFDRARLIKENEEYRLELEEKVKHRTEALEKANKQLKSTLWATVNALSMVTEKRDPYTAGHSQRVSKLASLLAKELGLSDMRVDAVQIAGLLHDIGKIYVPSEFLSKPTRLEEHEMEVIKTHTTVGYDILKNIPYPWPIAEIVYQHHERQDGSGYPRGLKDGELHIESQLIAIADIIEAMSSHRPYRPALGIEKAIDEILKRRDTQYFAEGVDAFMRLYETKQDKVKEILQI